MKIITRASDIASFTGQTAAIFLFHVHYGVQGLQLEFEIFIYKESRKECEPAPVARV